MVPPGMPQVDAVQGEPAGPSAHSQVHALPMASHVSQEGAAQRALAEPSSYSEAPAARMTDQAAQEAAVQGSPAQPPVQSEAPVSCMAGHRSQEASAMDMHASATAADLQSSAPQDAPAAYVAFSSSDPRHAALAVDTADDQQQHIVADLHGNAMQSASQSNGAQQPSMQQEAPPSAES